MRPRRGVLDASWCCLPQRARCALVCGMARTDRGHDEHGVHGGELRLAQPLLLFLFWQLEAHVYM